MVVVVGAIHVIIDDVTDIVGHEDEVDAAETKLSNL